MPRPKRTKITRTNTVDSTNTSNTVAKEPDHASDIHSLSRPSGQSKQSKIDTLKPAQDHRMSGALQTKQPSNSRRKAPGAQPPTPSGDHSDDTIQLDAGTDTRSRRTGAGRPSQSEAMSHNRSREAGATSTEERIEGRFTSVTKAAGRISGHVRGANPPSHESMRGFEEHIASSSPRPTQPASASRGAATPSFLSMSGFKRRPRQPSLLQMVQQQGTAEAVDDAGSDVEDSVLRDLEGSSPQVAYQGADVGSSARKRKAIEIEENQENIPPSSPPNMRSSSPPDGEVERDHEEIQVPATQRDPIAIFEDVEDEDQGQRQQADQREPPLSRRTSRPISRQSRATTHPSSPDLPQPSNNRVRSSQSPATNHSASTHAKLTHKTRPTARPPVRRRNGRIIKPKHAPPTQRSPSPAISAPSPISSSPPPPESQPAPQPPPAAKTKAHSIKVTHRRSDGRAPTDQPADPSTGQPKAKKDEPVTTEALRKLLPKRRANPRRQRAQQQQRQVQYEEFDIRSSSPAFAEEESFVSAPPAKGKTGAGQKGRQAMKPRSANAKVGTRTISAAANGEGKGTVNARSTAKSAAPAKPLNKPTAQSKRRTTYTRHPMPGQENCNANAINNHSYHAHEEDAEDADSAEETTFAEAAESTELKGKAKKFAEVDEWEMSFESCDIGVGSSSPWR